MAAFAVRCPPGLLAESIASNNPHPRISLPEPKSRQAADKDTQQQVSIHGHMLSQAGFGPGAVTLMKLLKQVIAEPSGVTLTFLGVPYYSYRVMGPKP